MISARLCSSTSLACVQYCNPASLLYACIRLFFSNAVGFEVGGGFLGGETNDHRYVLLLLQW